MLNLNEARVQSEPGRGIVLQRDVARLARCSPATVSRVFNAPETVAPEARRRVEEAVRQLGYMRNGMAQALRSRRTSLIGVAVPCLAMPNYARFVAALESHVSRAGLSLLVTSFGFALEREEEQICQMLERGAEAIVLVGAEHRPGLLHIMQTRGIPFVCTYTYRPDLPYPTLGWDNATLFNHAVERLVDLGHRDFAIITGLSRENDRAARHGIGIEARLARLGLKMPPQAAQQVMYGADTGREAFRRILDSGQRPTALICASDLLAQGALAECRDRGIRVPDDLSITGFSNHPFTTYLDPPLTTIDAPLDIMSRQALDTVLAQLKDEDTAHHLIAADLVVRASIAPAASRRRPLRRQGVREPYRAA